MATKETQAKGQSNPIEGVSAAERVVEILNSHFAGNQSAMARALGISQSVISRVVSGQQTPSTHLMMAIANLPQLNREWVLTGVGEPHRSAEQGVRLLPVTDCLLVGSPQAMWEKAVGVYPTVAEFASGSCYWLRVTSGAEELRAQHLQLQAGDMVLIDSAIDKYNDGEILARPRVIAVTWAGKDHPQLSLVGPGPAPAPTQERSRSGLRRNAAIRVAQKKSDSDGAGDDAQAAATTAADTAKREETRHPKREEAKPSTSDSDADQDSQVIGVCLQLLRRF